MRETVPSMEGTSVERMTLVSSPSGLVRRSILRRGSSSARFSLSISFGLMKEKLRISYRPMPTRILLTLSESSMCALRVPGAVSPRSSVDWMCS